MPATRSLRSRSRLPFCSAPSVPSATRGWPSSSPSLISALLAGAIAIQRIVELLAPQHLRALVLAGIIGVLATQPPRGCVSPADGALVVRHSSLTAIMLAATRSSAPATYLARAQSHWERQSPTPSSA